MDSRQSQLAELTSERPVSAFELRVKLFADGADLDGIRRLYADPLIKGFTTNPTLMRKAGITDYARFAREVVESVPDRPVSFEVFSDEPAEMERQARLLASWGEHVYVKIPITDTRGVPTSDLLRRLSAAGVNLNVTGLTTVAHVEQVTPCIADCERAIVSVFAGRIADTGVDPVPVMAAALEVLLDAAGAELLWASPREIFNIVQADRIGCHIITVTHELLKKTWLLGRDLTAMSLDTIRMFHDDARAARYTLTATT
jgi:transaldolase